MQLDDLRKLSDGINELERNAREWEDRARCLGEALLSVAKLLGIEADDNVEENARQAVETLTQKGYAQGVADAAKLLDEKQEEADIVYVWGDDLRALLTGPSVVRDNLPKE